MWTETLEGIRERHGRRWFLVLPTAFFGGVFVLVFSVPWSVVIDDSGATLNFVVWYSFAIWGAISAPKYKIIVAILIACYGVMFTYPWPGTPPYQDPDAPNRYAIWGGAIVGGSLAVALSYLQLRSRWLLSIPAYFVGGGIFLWPGLMSGLLEPVIGLTCMIACEFAISFLGAIAFAVLMAPAYKKKVTLGAFLLAIAFAFYSYLGPN